MFNLDLLNKARVFSPFVENIPNKEVVIKAYNEKNDSIQEPAYY